MTDKQQVTKSESTQASTVRLDLVQNAVKKWVRQSFDGTGNNRLLYYRHLKVGTLNLTTVGASRSTELLSGTRVSLPRLFESPDGVTDAAKRCRAIQGKAKQSVEERGIQTLKFAFGMATWNVDPGKPEPNAPVLMCSAVLHQRSRVADNFDIELLGDWELNPSLILELEGRTDLTNLVSEADLESLNGDASRLTNMLQQVERTAGGQVAGFKISEQLILGNFSYLKIAQAEKLKSSVSEIAEHTLLSAIAGDEVARTELRDQILDLSGESIDSSPPSEEYLILDADGSQSYAINAAIRGQNMVIVGPPGTGKSQTISNLIASLTARGKRILFVAEKRAAIEAVVKRLDGVGLGEIVLDMHDGKSSRKQIARDIANALSHTKAAPIPDVESLQQNLTSHRSSLNSYEASLHRKHSPWDISFYDVQSRLHSFSKESLPSFRFSSSELADLSQAEKELRKEQISEFIDLGGFEIRNGKLSPLVPAFESGTIQSDINSSEALNLLNSLTRSLADLSRQVRSVLADRRIEPVTVADLITLAKEIEDFKNIVTSFSFDFDAQDFQKLARDLAPLKSNPMSSILAILTNGTARKARRIVLDARKDTELTATDAIRKTRRLTEIDGNWTELPTEQELNSRAFNSIVQLTHKIINEAQRLDELLPFEFQNSISLDQFAGLLASMLQQRDGIAYLPKLIELRSSMMEKGMIQLVESMEDAQLSRENAVAAFDEIWLRSLADHISFSEPGIATFKFERHQQIVNEFRTLDRTHIASGRLRVQRSWAHNSVRARDENPVESEVVQHQARLKTRHMPTPQLLSSARTVLGALKPCWVMSPLVVAEKLPPGQNFDVVIFDEASQILPADAVLSLLQANQVIIAGDPHQLPPTLFFSSTEEEVEFENQNEDDQDENDSAAAAIQQQVQSGLQKALTSDIESILDVVSAVLPAPHGTRMLEWHYRSEDERLIAFSNAQPFLYNGQMTTFPGTLEGEAIDFLPVDHSHDSVKTLVPDTGPLASSSAEVAHVVDLIIQHATDFPELSLGVIAFGITHANRIEEALRRASYSHPELEEFLREDKDEPLFIKNLERVQGDERDAILISVGYSKSPDGRMRYNFGPLNRQGGERRLNVAITRARKSCKIISSFEANEMDPTRLRVNGTKMLRDYLGYAASHGADLGVNSQEKPQMNPFERDVHMALRESDITTVPQYGASGYFIDFAAMHPDRKGLPVLAIEADGASYHSSYSARDRDRLRQDHLERMGWTFHRIWSTEWFRNREQEIDRVKAAYLAAINKVDGSGNIPTGSGPGEPITLHIYSSERSGNCPVSPGGGIDDYYNYELHQLLDWIHSDGILRTRSELFAEMMKSLGFGRRGSKIQRRLNRAIEDYLSN